MATTPAFDQTAAAQAPALKVAILGFGTVGSAVARILCDQPANSPLRLTHVFNRNVERKRVDWVPADVSWSGDIEQVLASDADIIVELVGGLDPAHDWVSRALASGKSVVTANKKLIAQHGPQLSALARKHGGALSFGASVAGGVPVIDALQEGLAGDRSTGSAASSTAPATTFSPSWKAKASRLPKHSPGRRQPALPKPTPPTMSMATTPAPSWSSSPASACAPSCSRSRSPAVHSQRRRRRFRLRPRTRLHHPPDLPRRVPRRPGLCHGSALPGAHRIAHGAHHRQPQSRPLQRPIRRPDRVQRPRSRRPFHGRRRGQRSVRHRPRTQRRLGPSPLHVGRAARQRKLRIQALPAASP